ncbi:MAG: hypothetical protein II992_03560 [Lachnospiraceae bacterium]|nr:hypothetical protein [Lachnospiraceae bacterium]
MLKDKPIYIFAAILVAIVTIAISVVVSVYNENKPIEPNQDIKVVSSNDMLKVKSAYETEGKKQEFLELCSKIELGVANKLLDGTVTNDNELKVAIEKINKVLLTDDWSYIGLEASTYWMGKWELTGSGAVTFAFRDSNLKPDWAKDEDVKQYIK